MSNIHDIVQRRMERSTFHARDGGAVRGQLAAPAQRRRQRVKFLLEEVLVQETSLPDDFVVHIAGAGTQPDWLRSITKAGRFEVVNHGFLASLAPLYASCRVALAPLRYGAGVKGKVNQAMLHGVPVVATPIAVEGMHISSGEAVVADGAVEFARKLAEIYVDEAKWRNVAEAARLSVAKHFSVDVAAKRWASLESELALRSDSFRHALSEGSSLNQGSLVHQQEGTGRRQSWLCPINGRTRRPSFPSLSRWEKR